MMFCCTRIHRVRRRGSYSVVVAWTRRLSSTYEEMMEAEKRRESIPENFNFARDIFDKWASAEETGKRPALWFVHANGREEQISYYDLQQMAGRLAAGLEDIGMPHRALVLLPRRPEWWTVNLALARTGTVLCPGTTLLTSRDIETRLRLLKPDMIIADSESAAKVDQIEKAREIKLKILVGAAGIQRSGWLSYDTVLAPKGTAIPPCKDGHKEDILQIYFTSGTTGQPKMVPHTHGAYAWGHYILARYWLTLTPNDVHWNISDTGWAKSAWSNVFAPWIAGCTVFVHGMKSIDPDKALETLCRFPITTLCGPSTLFRLWVSRKEKLSSCARRFQSLRHCTTGGEPLNEEVLHQWRDVTGLDIYEGYGQTEMTLSAGTFKGMEIRPGSLGKVAPGYDVRIVDSNGEEVERGTEGQIGIRIVPQSPIGLFKGYVTESGDIKMPTAGDFYLTGDVASQDEDGYFWFTSRADDLINSAGYRISPFEVESALLTHDAVAESAAVSSPDKIRGEVVKSFIVLKEGAKERWKNDLETLAKQIQDHVKTVTAPYKYPRKISFVDALPKTVSGKILRRVLKDEEWKGNVRSKGSS